MSRKRREYTYEEWKKAMDLHNRFKLGPNKISRLLGINARTVKNWLYYGRIPQAAKEVLGIPKRREYIYEDWKKAINMLRKGYKPLEISRILGISGKTVEGWIYQGFVPPAAKWIAMPSNELGYVIGVLHGDASVSKVKPKNRPGYQYVIELAAIDKEFVETFSKAMARLLNRKYKEPWGDKRQRKWVTHYSSKAFYLWYKKIEEEGLEGFKPYIEYNRRTVKYYLKGLYDSDGGNNRNKYIRLDNTKVELLEYVQYLLEEYFNIKATGPYLVQEAGSTRVINGVERTLNHDCYRIIIGRKLHVEKFLREIGFSIVRKQRGLKKDEKVFVEGIGYVEPYELVKLGLFKLPFSDIQ